MQMCSTGRLPFKVLMDGKKNMDHGDALMALKQACEGLGGLEWQHICAIADKKLSSNFF